MAWFDDSAQWYLVLLAATWGLAPLVRLLCPRLPDRGATIARPLAVLGVVYPLWMLSSLKLLPYSTAGLWVTLVVLSAIGWGVLVWRRQVTWQWLRALLIAEGIALVAFGAYLWLRGYTPQILNTEKPMDEAFLAASARAVSMPPRDPWFAGQPINYYYIGYLLHGALTRMAGVSPTVGFNLALATTFSMTFTAAAGLGFNVARAWLGRGAAVAAGTLTAVLLVVVGNLYAAIRLIGHPSATIHAAWWGDPNNVVWNSTRIVCLVPSPLGACPASPVNETTINEFPAFSFILGDLHPHLMALPFTLVALALGLNALLLYRGGAAVRRRGGKDGARAFVPTRAFASASPEAEGLGRTPISRLKAGWRPGAWRTAGSGGRVGVLLAAPFRGETRLPPDRAQQASAPTPVVADAAVSPLLPTAGEWATFAVSGAVVGALYALNSWDYPTYLVVLLAALWLGLRWAPSRVRWTALAVTVAVSVLAWAPFIVTFKPFAGGNVAELPAALRHVPVVTKILTTIGAVTGKRTTAVEFLTIFGVPYVAALALIGLGLWRTRQAAGGRRQATGDEPTPDARRLTPLVVALAVALLAAIVLSAPLVILCGVPFVAAVVLLRRQPEITPRTIALALFAFGLALILLTEFFYIQDVFQSRMNTLFKVYYQAWAMFALATALAVVLLWRAARRIPVARLAVGAGVAVALAAGLVFTALAPYAFTSHFASWQGLDGSAYLTASGNGDEVAAFAWLRQHATSKDVLLEAPGCSYEPFGEMPYDSAAAFSGVPTVIGWIGHEQQWRNGQPALYAEIGTRAQQVPSMYANPSGALAKQYGVTLLYVGRYEQQQSDPTCTFAGKGPYPVVNSPSFPGPGWTEVFHQGDVRIYRRAA